ncbi:inositol phospholipid synthesis and fat-storage-inducing TM-domain-containing protein [Lentinula raphanica]|uniref:Inositol phospholipid synthesis and fat-storage-inducing TM-domain-containing protein n=1 Tax=Lentinula raphanica TaxID=153919 RepID=A0AA38NY88_9AGAR|nr:inositol phospholipid synthesis and fat-storage-inducing TM-domain-containing protein [Lentinula raphanica]KAJ3772914.1 inositol phospholipid synthesis and fat-storage-inducing TM-domain-containing protein [Lentinula raphanica]KAJ3830147.1 inositol phospholipid synthesis and fat-storage-inducing TM-domain-containing protein [Lentinula raphanica]KAJ3832716.1 inositol phospholipid synthesis and fat-storage-inducing TM-domain-containing protein [Lentinula raphanica]
MYDLRLVAFTAVTLAVSLGTAYSIIYGTYLDTSDPLLAHLAHPLALTNYWARKSNVLNVYFIKKAWGWTSAAFLLLWATTTPSQRTLSRVMQWLTATACWLTFTTWFFGPAVIDRVNLASGGDCFVHLPSGDLITVPTDYCFTKSTVTPISHPDIFTSSLVLPEGWSGIPRLRRGHDVSGHVFLLTMSVLFLADQLSRSLRFGQSSFWNKLAMAANVVLISIWLFASVTTSVYFHSPFEKVTGYVLGLVSFAVTQTSVFS